MWSFRAEVTGEDSLALRSKGAVTAWGWNQFASILTFKNGLQMRLGGL
jgi:hypothetical protein